MLTWIKTSRELRIALAICSGLLLYRLIMYVIWACWYYSLFNHIDSDVVAIAGFYGGLPLIIAMSVWLWRSRRRSRTAS